MDEGKRVGPSGPVAKEVIPSNVLPPKVAMVCIDASILVI